MTRTRSLLIVAVGFAITLAGARLQFSGADSGFTWQQGVGLLIFVRGFTVVRSGADSFARRQWPGWDEKAWLAARRRAAGIGLTLFFYAFAAAFTWFFFGPRDATGRSSDDPNTPAAYVSWMVIAGSCLVMGTVTLVQAVRRGPPQDAQPD